MEAVRLTKNFTLKELCSTNHPKFQDEPTTQQIVNLTYLCAAVLQPLRDYLGEPVIITSGFRSTRLNKHVGGVSNSLHTRGFAADIRIKSEQHAKKMFDFLKTIRQIDTCLIERSNSARWLHVQVSYNPRRIFNYNFNL